MRLVQIVVPEDAREEVLGTLDDAGVDYASAPGEAEGSTLVHFPLPTQAVETVLGDLEEAGIDEDDYLVVASAETARTPHYQDLEEQFAGTAADDSIADEELRAKVRTLSPDPFPYYAMTLLSTLVATVGLLLDSPAVVVGSMVIAPQVGSALETAVGTVRGDEPLFTTGVRDQVLSLALAVLGAAALGWAVRSAAFVPPPLDLTTVSQISSRISPGMLSLLVAVCAGAAGAFGLATDLPVSLAGVAVAAAIVPAAAAVGVGLAWGYPAVVVGAGVLLLINAVCINLAAVSVLGYLGYRPPDWPGGFGAALRGVAGSRAGLVVGVVTLVVLVATGALVADQAAFENDTNAGVEAALDAPAYDDLTLLSVHPEFTDLGFSGSPELVSVTVARPPDEAYPDLPERIETAVERRTGSDVVVQVEFTERTRTAERSDIAAPSRVPAARASAI